MSYVYKRTHAAADPSETRWTVGYHLPDGRFEPESDHTDPDLAAQRTAWLNGSSSGRNQYQPLREAEICFTVFVLQVQGGNPAHSLDTWYTMDTLTETDRDGAIQQAAHRFPGEPTRLLLRVTTDEVIWSGVGVDDKKRRTR